MFNGLHSEIHSITVFPSEEVRTSAVQTGVTGVRCVKGRGGRGAAGRGGAGGGRLPWVTDSS